MKRQLLLVSLFTVITVAGQAQQPNDTIYYTFHWDITEKPFAKYYRIGEVVIDSFWYYRGTVKDYYMDGKLEMEGAYNGIGYKEGVFNSYYHNGQLAATGRYTNDKMLGQWTYYHENGKLKALINHEGDDFSFVRYADSAGTVMLENGTGSFEWFVREKRNTNHFILKGFFNKGLKDGTWNYCDRIEIGGDDTRFRETYENGRFKKGKAFSYVATESYKKPVEPSFDESKLRVTETFSSDSYLNKFGNSTELFNLLTRKQPPVFTDTSSGFGGSIAFMINTLNKFRYRFPFDSNYNGKAMFLIDEEGYPKNVSIQGNLPENEKEKVQLLINKFRMLKTPGYESVAIDAYHTIYFFTLDTKEFLKKSETEYATKEFIFSLVPMDKMKANLRIERQH